MDFYTLFKMLHVFAAVAWVGGGLAMTILAMRAARSGDPAELSRAILVGEPLSKLVFIPGGVLTLVLGAIATTLWGLWGQMWVILSLVGLIASMGIGGAVLSRSIRVVAAEGEGYEGVQAAERYLRFAQFDVIQLFTVIGVMVLKPTWAEWWMLFVVAAIVGGAFYFLIYPLMNRRLAGA